MSVDLGASADISSLSDVFDFATLLDHPTPQGDPCGADFPDRLYYSFRHRGVLFVVLRVNDDYHDLFECNGFEDGYADCADYCANAPASPTRSDRCYNVHQYDWLREVLEAADGDAELSHRIVLLHAPLYTSYDDHAPTSSFGALVPLLGWPVSGPRPVALPRAHRTLSRPLAPLTTATSTAWPCIASSSPVQGRTRGRCSRTCGTWRARRTARVP